jgi:hypothetical protein
MAGALLPPRCFCPCHAASVLPVAPPVVTDPIEALACCDLCEPLHRGVWKLHRKTRITRRWVDPQADGDGEKK